MLATGLTTQLRCMVTTSEFAEDTFRYMHDSDSRHKLEVFGGTSPGLILLSSRIPVGQPRLLLSISQRSKQAGCDQDEPLPFSLACTYICELPTFWWGSKVKQSSW